MTQMTGIASALESWLQQDSGLRLADIAESLERSLDGPAQALRDGILTLKNPEPSLADMYFVASDELRETKVALRAAQRRATRAEKKAAQLELESATRAQQIQALEDYLRYLSLTDEHTIDYRDMPPPKFGLN
jgi:DNA-binding transcriptional MerR regulator